MATLGELDQAVITARDAGCEQLILLKCTSTYQQLQKIQIFQRPFEAVVCN